MLGIRIQAPFSWGTFYYYANLMESAYWESQGYMTVLNEETGLKELVSKNEKTGQDDEAATRTIKWGEIELDENGEEFVYSYSNDPRFADWKDTWAQMGFPPCFTEEEVVRPVVIEEY